MNKINENCIPHKVQHEMTMHLAMYHLILWASSEGSRTFLRADF